MSSKPDDFDESPEVLFSVPKVIQMTTLGKTTINYEIQSGRLHSIKVGRRRLIPESAYKKWLVALGATEADQEKSS